MFCSTVLFTVALPAGFQILPEYLVLIYASVLGALVGSFLNVVIYRVGEGKSVVKPRSHCPQCKTQLQWFDNIPILSWVFLRAKCRHCKAHIAFRYPLVELLAAALSWGLVYRYGLGSDVLVMWPVCMAFLALAFIDLDHWFLPDVIVLPMLAFVSLATLLPGGITPLQGVVGLVPAALVWLTSFLFRMIRKKEGMGMGDIKLLAVIGVMMGVVDGIGVVFLASIQGAVIGSLVVFGGGHQGKSAEFEDGWKPPPTAVPFGPFLVLASYEILLLPEVFSDVMGRLGHWFVFLGL